ncbi:hypothetical protein GCM10020258_41600 [Sphingomonas yabuuchiae]
MDRAVSHPFLDRYPAIRLRLDLTDDFIDVIDGGIDLAIRITATPPSGLEAHRLADNRRVLCASPAYLARAGTPQSIADLADHALLAAQGQFPWRLTGATVNGESRVETPSSEVVRELVLGGAGLRFAHYGMSAMPWRMAGWSASYPPMKARRRSASGQSMRRRERPWQYPPCSTICARSGATQHG